MSEKKEITEVEALPLETPDYVISDNYSNVKIVLAHGVTYTMGNNGYVWHTNLRRWIPFYKVLFDI